MVNSNPRKSPYRVRKQSAAEFSRVTSMLHADDLAMKEKIAIMGAEIGELGAELKKIKNRLKRKKSVPDNVDKVENIEDCCG